MISEAQIGEGPAIRRSGISQRKPPNEIMRSPHHLERREINGERWATTGDLFELAAAFWASVPDLWEHTQPPGNRVTLSRTGTSSIDATETTRFLGEAPLCEPVRRRAFGPEHLRSPIRDCRRPYSHRCRRTLVLARRGASYRVRQRPAARPQ